jgi:hypothetical protein
LSIYKVITPFRDKDTQDLFGVDDQYYTEDPERAAYLKQEGYLGEEIPQEEQVDDDNGDEWPKHVGGGYYELPNGEKVKGKENALKELAEINQEDGE